MLIDNRDLFYYTVQVVLYNCPALFLSCHSAHLFLSRVFSAEENIARCYGSAPILANFSRNISIWGQFPLVIAFLGLLVRQFLIYVMHYAWIMLYSTIFLIRNLCSISSSVQKMTKQTVSFVNEEVCMEVISSERENIFVWPFSINNTELYWLYEYYSISGISAFWSYCLGMSTCKILHRHLGHPTWHLENCYNLSTQNSLMFLVGYNLVIILRSQITSTSFFRLVNASGWPYSFELPT